MLFINLEDLKLPDFEFASLFASLLAVGFAWFCSILLLILGDVPWEGLRCIRYLGPGYHLATRMHVWVELDNLSCSESIGAELS